MARKTVSLQLCGGGGRVQVPEWNNVNCEINTIWSNNSQAADDSVCNVTTYWDNRYIPPARWEVEEEKYFYFFGVGSYAGGTLLDHITIDGVVLSSQYYWDDGISDDPNYPSCYGISTDCVSHDVEHNIDVVLHFQDGSAYGLNVTVIPV